MTTAERTLNAVATGNFETARLCYTALLSRGLFDEQDLTGGHLDPAAVDLNSVLTRWRVLAHLAATNADGAYAVIK